MVRAMFIGNATSGIAQGTVGTAWGASGFTDPSSAEFGAFLFRPDGQEVAYYCDPKRDLSFTEVQ